ncbi:hypothetical protein [Asticcacaulis tiandongensis]|uniref:hypothetical protein n=1 Tax=Asticcacaulis tiandongensis TaxID=2565365 RepID=UPI001127A417|nr:hypothetical protein [Asticcacaulis tiandongensis]
MRLVFPLLAAVLMTGCATGDEAVNGPVLSETIQVSKSTGSKQCEDGGKSLDALRGELAQAGVRVTDASCGSDGRMYPAACGYPDGRIVIFSIAAKDTARAKVQGYSLLAEDATKIPCPE